MKAFVLIVYLLFGLGYAAGTFARAGMVSPAQNLVQFGGLMVIWPIWLGVQMGYAPNETSKP